MPRTFCKTVDSFSEEDLRLAKLVIKNEDLDIRIYKDYESAYIMPLLCFEGAEDEIQDLLEVFRMAAGHSLGNSV